MGVVGEAGRVHPVSWFWREWWGEAYELRNKDPVVMPLTWDRRVCYDISTGIVGRQPQ